MAHSAVASSAMLRGENIFAPDGEVLGVLEGGRSVSDQHREVLVVSAFVFCLQC